MKNNKPLIVILVIVVLAVAGWVGYKTFQTKKVEDIFLLIPAEASMVIEINDIKSFYQKTLDKNSIAGLLSIPVLKDWTQRMDGLIPLLDSATFSGALSKEQSLYCSVHASASKELGLLWYVSFEDKNWETEIASYLKDHLKSADYTLEQRNYEGHVVYDLFDKHTKQSFTFAWHRNVLVGSYTGYLVEDVLRLVRSQHENHFMSAFEEQRQSRKIHYDDGNLFVNFSRMPQFIACYASDSTTSMIQGLASFAEIGVYDITLDSNKWLFHGYTHHKAGVGNYSAVFEGQKTQTFSLNEYVPMNTSLCYFWGMDKGKEWYRKWTDYNTLGDKEYINKVKDWEVQHHIAIEHEFMGVMGNEMALLSFPLASASDPIEKVLLIKTKHKEKASELMNEWRTRNKTIQQSLYAEYYDGHKIHQWGADQLPFWLCGDMAKGFNQVYYTFVQDVLVLGNSISAVKNIVKSYNNQDVWRRNVDMVSRWKDLTASNFSLFIQPSALKSTLLQAGLNPVYASALKQYDQQYNLLKSIVIQFGFTQGKLYTNAVIEHNFSMGIRSEVKRFKQISKDNSVPVNATLYTVTVSDNWTDVLYTDSLHTLSLVNNKGEAAWSFAVGSPLQTQISSGDFNKDGSSDYIFIAGNKIHAISNKGQELSGFPMNLSDTLKPAHLVVIDYDLTKNYRLSITDLYGKVMLIDMTGKALEGWSNKDFGTSLYLPVTHIRIGTNDRIIAFNASGDFYCLNRRAEIQMGFPLSTGQPTISPCYLSKGTSLSDSYIYTLSDKGLKCKFNLEGKLEAKTELPRTFPTGKFMLVKANNNNARQFYMANWDESSVQLLDEAGTPLFIAAGAFSNELKISCIIQDESAIFLLQDETTGFSRVYDSKGSILHDGSGTGNLLTLLTKKDQSGYAVYLLEIKAGKMHWLKLEKAVEEVL